MKINSDLIVYNNLSFEDSFKQINNNIIGLKGTVLFNGNTTGNVTLIDDSANYNYIEIFYKQNQNYYSSVKVENPNGKSVSIVILIPSNYDNGFWIQGKVMLISGNTIKTILGRQCETRVTSSGVLYGDGNNVSIIKVVGYKIN